MNKEELIEFLNFSLLESKSLEDRLYRKEIPSYLPKVSKEQFKTITSEFIL